MTRGKTLLEVFTGAPPPLQERFTAALDALCPHLCQWQLEERLGLSVGYLSQCRPAGRRQPSKLLVLVLEMLARHPEHLGEVAGLELVDVLLRLLRAHPEELGQIGAGR